MVLYDVTSTYFEGRSCPLAQLGYSRDGKRDKLQIVIGLLCAADGCPVAVEVFEGNCADSTTVNSQIRKIRERFGIERVILVGDRGMITEARIREDLRGVAGLDWITALRGPQIRGLMQGGSIQLSLFDTRDMAEITHPDYPGERLIVCRNPLLARQRAHKREELLRATEKELDKVALATTRDKRRLQGKDKIGLRVGKLIGKFKMAKHFDTTIEEQSFSYRRKEADHRQRSGPGRDLCDPHQCAKAGPGDQRNRRSIQESQSGRAGVSVYEERRSQGSSHPSSPGRTREESRLLVHAGLLRGMAHARSSGSDPV